MQQLSQERCAAVLERWRGMILGTYSPDARAFFRREKDRFANPVGYTIGRSTEILWQRILADGDPADPAITEALEDIVRLRAVQDFSPSQAVAFVFLLKQAVREVLADSALSGEALSELDRRVDHLALAAFDLYMRCREQMHDIRVREIRNRTTKLVERANLLFEDSIMNPGPDDGSNGAPGKGVKE